MWFLMQPSWVSSLKTFLRKTNSPPEPQKVDIAKLSYFLASSLFLLPGRCAGQAGTIPGPGSSLQRVQASQPPAGLQSPGVFRGFCLFVGWFACLTGCPICARLALNSLYKPVWRPTHSHLRFELIKCWDNKCVPSPGLSLCK